MVNRAAVIGWAMLLAAFAVSFSRTEAGVTIAAPNAIEGIEWMLIELNSIPVSPLAGELRPFLKFDAERRQATGFAGCNNFFGAYECDGSSLKFGRVASTRIACPDLQLSLETEFFNALDRTRSWRIDDGELLLLDEGHVIARFAMAQGQ